MRVRVSPRAYRKVLSRRKQPCAKEHRELLARSLESAMQRMRCSLVARCSVAVYYTIYRIVRLCGLIAMPHLSRQKINQTVVTAIFSQLLAVVSNSASARRGTHSPLAELLTHTEKLMLAKRLAVIFLLSEGIPSYRIVRKLKVSPSTVARLNLGISSRYSNLTAIARRQKMKSVGRLLDTLLSISFPRKTGPRWKWLDEFYESRA